MRKVLIVGGGIAGLSSAIALRQAGWQVDVVEINRSREIYHVGIIVQSNFLRALDRLGVADEAIENGFAYSGFDLCALDGSVDAYISGVALSRENHPTDLGLTRPALHDILLRAASKWGVKPKYNVTFERIEQTDCTVNVSFTDGTVGQYDMMIGADGLYSKTRTTIFDPGLLPQYTGQAVWRYNLPRPPDVVRTAIFQGASGGKAGYCPLNDDTMYLLLVMREPGNPWIPKDKLSSAFTDRLRQFGGLVGHIRDTVDFDPDQIVYRPLEAILVPPPWYRGRVLLIGDAAHGTTPHLGQGAAQAVEDAVVLGELANSDDPVDVIMKKFMNRRFDRCKLIWDSSRQIGQWEIDDDPTADVPSISAKIMQSLSQAI